MSGESAPEVWLKKMLSPGTEIQNVTSGALNSLMRINREWTDKLFYVCTKKSALNSFLLDCEGE